MKLFLISFFGMMGVVARYILGTWMGRILPIPFPYGTLLINILGAFGIGVFYVLGVERSTIPVDLRLGIMVGFLGGFTTFSTYCLEFVRLLEEADYASAALYLGMSNIVGVLATVGGLGVTRLIFK